jgi:hypothetical protein
MAKRPQRRTARNNGTAIIGGLLIGLAIVGFIWLLLSHFGAAMLSSANPFLTAAPTSTAGVLPNNTPVVQVPSLAAEGITLKQATQAAALSRQEALLIAGQLEPVAASQAKYASTQYVLLNYSVSSTATGHANTQNVLAWMIEYQQIPSSTQSSYDLYVFLDANTGRELLSVRV